MSLYNIDALDAIKIRARGNVFNLAQLIRNYRVLLIGLPGAFTPVDTNVYIPELIAALPFLDKRLDYIFCVLWNDPFVTKSWVLQCNIPKKVKVIADWNGYLTKSVGMEMDANEYYLGTRSKRYAAIYDNGKLLWNAEADNAYPNYIIDAVNSFDYWLPSKGLVDNCSNYSKRNSPKSKFHAANFLAVESGDRLEDNSLEGGCANGVTSLSRGGNCPSSLLSSVAQISPTFKGRFVSQGQVAMKRGILTRDYSTRDATSDYEDVYYSSSAESSTAAPNGASGSHKAPQGDGTGSNIRERCRENDDVTTATASSTLAGRSMSSYTKQRDLVSKESTSEISNEEDIIFESRQTSSSKNRSSKMSASRNSTVKVSQIPSDEMLNDAFLTAHIDALIDDVLDDLSGLKGGEFNINDKDETPRSELGSLMRDSPRYPTNSPASSPEGTMTVNQMGNH